MSSFDFEVGLPIHLFNLFQNSKKQLQTDFIILFPTNEKRCPCKLLAFTIFNAA